MDNMAPILIVAGALAAAVEDAVVVCVVCEVAAVVVVVEEEVEEQPARMRLEIKRIPRRIPRTLFIELPPSNLFILIFAFTG
jgi:hypothetical protein